MQGKNGKTSNILVIDNESNMPQLHGSILTSKGFTVKLATDGINGTLLLRGENPDLVLFDIMMPGPDGFLVIDRIWQKSNAPVIMLIAKCEINKKDYRIQRR